MKRKTKLWIRLIFLIGLLVFLLYILIFKFYSLELGHVLIIFLLSLTSIVQAGITIDLLRETKYYEIKKKIK